MFKLFDQDKGTCELPVGEIAIDVLVDSEGFKVSACPSELKIEPRK